MYVATKIQIFTKSENPFFITSWPCLIWPQWFHFHLYPIFDIFTAGCLWSILCDLVIIQPIILSPPRFLARSYLEVKFLTKVGGLYLLIYFNHLIERRLACLSWPTETSQNYNKWRRGGANLHLLNPFETFNSWKPRFNRTGSILWTKHILQWRGFLKCPITGPWSCQWIISFK